MRGVRTHESEPTHRDLVEDKVHQREYDRHSERVSPHPNDRHDVRMSIMWLVTRNPAKDGEYTGKDVDTEDGPHKLPGRPSSGATSDEDQPVLRKKDREGK